MKIWVLTEEYNEYDQYGEYYITAFSKKPSVGQLMKTLGVTEDYALWLLYTGGGRRGGWEESWNYLREEEIE